MSDQPVPTPADVAASHTKRTRTAEAESVASSAAHAEAERVAILQSQVNDMEQSLTAVRAQALRSDIAARHGISAEDRDLLLTGSDEATLTAQAEHLAARDTASRLSRANVARREGQVVGIRRTGEQEEMREFASQLFDTDDPFA